MKAVCRQGDARSKRSLWPDGTNVRVDYIDGCDRQLDPAVLDRIIAKIPIDGKEYRFAEVGFLGNPM